MTDNKVTKIQKNGYSGAHVPTYSMTLPGTNVTAGVTIVGKLNSVEELPEQGKNLLNNNDEIDLFLGYLIGDVTHETVAHLGDSLSGDVYIWAGEELKWQNLGPLVNGKLPKVDVSSSVDTEYNRVANDILDNGISKGDRTGTGTLSTFGQHMEFDISNGKIPMLTTKKVHLRVIIHELLWMLSGDTNIRYLKENNVHIWDSWVNPDTAEYYYYTDEEIFNILRGHFNTPTIHFDIDPSTKRRYTRNEDGSVTIRKDPLCDLAAVYRVLFTKEPRRLISGDLPNVYGKQWRRWVDTKVVSNTEWQKGKPVKFGYKEVGVIGEKVVISREIDQIANILDQLKNNPDSRRIILNAWNVGDIDQMALPPCHAVFQLWTRELTIDERLAIAEKRSLRVSAEDWLDGPEPEGEGDLHAFLTSLEIPKRELSSQLLQRSADFSIGVPFNIVQYVLLTHILAHVCNMTTSTFKWVGGDVHVYSDQVEILKRQLENEPMEDKAWIMLNPGKRNIDDFVYDDFKLFDYESHGVVKYPPAAV